MLMRDLDQIEPPEETGADRHRRQTRKRTDTVETTARDHAAPDHFAAPLALKPAREFLCFPHEGRRIAIAIDSLHLLGSTASGARVEMLFGSSSLDGFLVGADTIANASVMTTINAIGYVTGTLKIRDKGASPEALARECAAAVAARKLGDKPQVSRKGMALGSIIPHHPPADPTDPTTLTGEDDDDGPLTPEEVKRLKKHAEELKVEAHAANLLVAHSGDLGGES